MDFNLSLDEVKAKSKRTEKLKMHVKLTVSQLDSVKDEYISLQKEIAEKKEELSVLTKIKKEYIKELAENAKLNLDILKDETIYKEVTCYLVPNYNSNRMHYYLPDGSYSHCRELREEEQQTEIFE